MAAALRLPLDRAYRAPFDLQATITTPYVNIPAGGTRSVNVNVERRGYMGPIRIEATNLPKGVSIAGGDIPAEIPDPNNRATSRRAMLSLTADLGATSPHADIDVKAVAVLRTEKRSFATPAESGIAIPVAGATAQGVVDRQRPLTGAWLGHELPAALTDARRQPCIDLEKSEKKEADMSSGSAGSGMSRTPCNACPRS